MPTDGEILYKSRETILDEFSQQFVAAIPDVYLGPDGNLYLLLQVMAGVIESVFQGVQIVADDMFVTDANEEALEKWGDQYGVPRSQGTKSTGTLTFQGNGGVVIPVGSEVAYDPGTGEDPYFFVTTALGTLPNPGIPTAPTVANGGAGGQSGTYEYAITFVTAAGETEIGAESTAIVISSAQVSLSAIPLGGTGTTARKVYRQKDGSGIWNLVATIGDNTTTVLTDNVADSAVGSSPPVGSTAERVVVAAESESPGTRYNVLPGTIQTPSRVPDGVTDVVNNAAFTGGTDQESVETFRQRLLTAIRNPFTGSAADLKFWAEEVDGVETATVFSNDNLGTPTNGHATVRISGPNGTVPDAGVQAAVLAYLNLKDMANITLHVGTFTQTSTNVTVTLTLVSGFTIQDVQAAVVTAVTNYINSLPVGDPLRVAGIVAAVMSVPGVSDVVVASPTSNQTTASTAKRVAGTITVQ